VRSGWLAAVPPDRQLSPVQLQLTSLVSSLSRQLPAADAILGEITTVSAIAPARKAAAVAVEK
jgi:hypothetical protein